MSGRTRGRPRIEQPDAPPLENAGEEQPPLQFATVEQIAILQNQMSTIMEMLQGMAGPSHVQQATPAEEALQAPEVPPAVEVPPSETTHVNEMTPTSHHLIPTNWESILNKKFEEAIARRKSRGRPISIKEEPFTEEVMNVPLPQKFKESTGEFDGTTDPIDHIRTFQDRVRLHAWPDAIACRAFPMTLRKDAREWVDIKNLQMPSVVTALLSGLRNHGFRASLSKKPPESMIELLRRGEEYIDQEELNMPLSTILREISTLKELRWPEKLLSDPSIRDRSCTCEFHKDHGHTTDQCRTLHSEVERLAGEGFIKHFVKRYGNHHKETPEDVGQRRRAGVINVIVRGSAGGGDSRNSRKGYARSLQMNLIAVSSKFNQPITFDDEDLNGVSLPHDDALVITGDIADFDVKRVPVDTGIAANVLSWDAFAALKMPADRLKSVNTPLQGFGGGVVILEGVIDLLVVLRKYLSCISLITPFLIVRALMAYNSIYGRPIINAVGAVVSTQHQSMKFPTSRGIGVVRRDQLTSRRCYVDSIRMKVNPISEVKPVALEIEKRDHEQANRFKPADEVEVVALEENKCIKIGRSLNAEDRNEMLNMLRENMDVFAWGSDDFPGIDPSVAQHRLNNVAGYKPVKQRKRYFVPDHQKVIREELDKLLKAGFIREVEYPEWLANVVLVKKSTGKWRMCIDFTDLNKACPKDCFPLPRIDALIDATVGKK
ncbi:Ribonuclease H [Abeliophyllum distichum]|uniref:Ribonuclease H n=1 Tax=Abeliophyllum distichum TaxID=126358 RepID=A0ABD1V4V8_9LAMI